MHENLKICPNCSTRLDSYDAMCTCGFNFRKSAVVENTDSYDSEERLKDLEWAKDIMKRDMRSGYTVFIADRLGLKGNARRAVIVSELIICVVVLFFYMIYFRHLLSGILLILVYLLCHVSGRYLHNRTIYRRLKVHA